MSNHRIKKEQVASANEFVSRLNNSTATWVVQLGLKGFNPSSWISMILYDLIIGFLKLIEPDVFPGNKLVNIVLVISTAATAKLNRLIHYTVPYLDLSIFSTISFDSPYGFSGKVLSLSKIGIFSGSP